MAKANREKDEAIAKMKQKMAEEIEAIKRQADETYRTLAEEKARQIQLLQKEKVTEIRKVEDSALKPTKTGWLQRKGGGVGAAVGFTSGWVKQYFVLKSNYLFYYNEVKVRKPMSLFARNGLTIVG